MINTEIRSKLENCFQGLVFDEAKHKYTFKNKVMISTTQFLKRFVSPFNAYFISEAKGKKNLRLDPNDTRDGKYYRNRWKLLGSEAGDRGTRIHQYAECYPYFDEPRDWMEQGVLDFYNWIPSNYQVVALELRVYDEETSHAGTIDGILFNKDTGKLVLFDWKQNSKNIYDVFANKKMLNEFSDLSANLLNKFTLQLSDYANTINKNTEFEVEDRWVVWLNQEDDKRASNSLYKTSYLNVIPTLDLSDRINTAYIDAINSSQKFTSKGLQMVKN